VNEQTAQFLNVPDIHLMARKNRSEGARKEVGPKGYENWRLSLAGTRRLSVEEVPLDSDTRVTSEVIAG
jgi:hypothetical protein